MSVMTWASAALETPSVTPREEDTADAEEPVLNGATASRKVGSETPAVNGHANGVLGSSRTLPGGLSGSKHHLNLGELIESQRHLGVRGNSRVSMDAGRASTLGAAVSLGTSQDLGSIVSAGRGMVCPYFPCHAVTDVFLKG